jgi:HEAT repeat protein
MPVSYAQLKALLDVDEPDYAKLATRVAGAMHHLRKLAASDDPSVASKAVSLAGIIADADSIAVVADAARSRNALVRVAAAHAASLLPDSPQAARVVSKLLGDDDIGVAKIAVRAAARQSDPALAPAAQRASAHLSSAVRAAMQQHTQRERTAAMAMKAAKKAGSGAAPGKAIRARAAAGQMPTGAMVEPPKGAKARAMPTGKMK